MRTPPMHVLAAAGGWASGGRMGLACGTLPCVGVNSSRILAATTGGMGGISKLADAVGVCLARRSSVPPPRGRRKGGTGDGPIAPPRPSGGAGGGRCEGGTRPPVEGTKPPPDGGPKPLGVRAEGVLLGDVMREAVERCECGEALPRIPGIERR